MSSLLEKWFRWKLGEAEIKREPSLNMTGGSCGRDCPKVVKAAAVQRRITVLNSIKAYEEVMESFVRSAAEQGCNIIAFPEYNFLELLGVIPGFGLLNRYLNSKAVSITGNSTDNSIERLYPFVYNISEPIQAAIERVMCRLAAEYKIYIYTGSYFIRDRGFLYNGGSIISPGGNIVGRQMKLHLTDFEEKLGIRRGNEFKVFPLSIGNIAFPVCMDGTYYEVFNIARSLSCDIVILPIANNEEYSLYRALRGIWPRVQESHLYGVKSALNGWFCGMHFTGRAGIFAPMGMTPGEDGIIAISEHFDGNFLVVGNMDLQELNKEREEDEYYGDHNPEFEKEYYKNTYLLALKD